MIFCLKEDDPLSYQSLDTRRTYFCLGVCRRQPKYTEVFEPAMSTMLPRQWINWVTDLFDLRPRHTPCSRSSDLLYNKKTFQHVETLFVQGNIFVPNQNKPPCLVINKKRLTIVNLFFITKRGGLFWFSTKILPWMNKVSACRNVLLSLCRHASTSAIRCFDFPKLYSS